ncbi:pyruvate, phosphate dikinase, partial [Candidatus Peregrinibacteria bacterium]|nr:pyruvate, phosphate dikinase [Candidatus Peregrinibacteria bacterium]
MQKYVYSFSEAQGNLKTLLGGKGANLAEMTCLNIPVPPGFTVTTDSCNAYLNNNKKFPEGLWTEVLGHIKQLEKASEKGFGSSENPLLVSVRSGAPVSMPGMMDTILNLGLNDDSVIGLAQKTGNERFAYDSYRRFIQMFGNVVLKISGELFEEIIENIKNAKNLSEDSELSPGDWKEVIEQFKALVKQESGSSFPEDPYKQLERAVRAVFSSWLTPRAITYRRIHKIADDLGTAVNIQTMVFGNMGDTSGTGVAFTRNPSTGENSFYGEFLMNAQGEDVVAGIRTPQNITELKTILPDVYEELCNVYKKLEAHFKDMQDIEFTIEEGKLYMLQTRNGKRSAAAALKIAVDMVSEGVIHKKKALKRIDPAALDSLMHPQISKSAQKNILTQGLPASPGAAVGQAVFNSNDAEEWVKQGKKVVLIRHETSPEDIHGMHAASGVLTACGGMTSHAAVVARGMGTPCVSGASKIIVNVKMKKANIGEITINEGDFITIDGSSGGVILGKCETEMPNLSGDFETILEWANEYRSL